MTLNDLMEQVENIKRRIRERYAFAKSLGFTAAEAQLLQNNSEETIRRLADERKAKTK